jgi:hypothetical protein
MSNFEERLLTVLKEEISTRTHPVAVRRPRRRLAGLTVAGVAAAATVAATLTGVFGSPAYAVTKGADGVVSVEINAFEDPHGLESELADAGIKAVVDYLPFGQTCKGPRGEPGGAGGRVTSGVGKSDKGVFFRIEKGQVPAGQTLVLTFSLDRGGADRPPFSGSMQVVKGAVTDCEPIAMPVPPAGDGTKDDGPSNDSSTQGDDKGPSLHTEQG